MATLADVQLRLKADWAAISSLLGKYSAAVSRSGQRQGNAGATATEIQFYNSQIRLLRNAGASPAAVQKFVSARDQSSASQGNLNARVVAAQADATKIKNEITATVARIQQGYVELLSIADARIAANDKAAGLRVAALDKNRIATQRAAVLRVADAERRVSIARNGLPAKIVFSRSLPITGNSEEKKKQQQRRVLLSIFAAGAGALIGGVPGAIAGATLGNLGVSK